MDIYSAKNHVERVLKYAEGLSAHNVSKSYKPTQGKLRYIADACDSISHIINDLLSDTYQPNTASSSTAGTSVDCRQTIKIYRDTLRSLYQSNYNATVDRCTALLWQWFETRFYKSVGIGSCFKYNVSYIGTWIQDFIIALGYHIQSNTFDAFESTLYSWFESIQLSENRYPLPYDVYKEGSNACVNNYTLCSVVLWDILSDLGLSAVMSEDSDVFVSSDSMYARCCKMNPSALDDYSNYKYDPDVLIRSNLIREEGDDA